MGGIELPNFFLLRLPQSLLAVVSYIYFYFFAKCILILYFQQTLCKEKYVIYYVKIHVYVYYIYSILVTHYKIIKRLSIYVKG